MFIFKIIKILKEEKKPILLYPLEYVYNSLGFICQGQSVEDLRDLGFKKKFDIIIDLDQFYVDLVEWGSIIFREDFENRYFRYFTINDNEHIEFLKNVLRYEVFKIE